MKIILIPWVLNSTVNNIGNLDRIIPLGIMSISAYLKQMGHNVKIFDFNLINGISYSSFAELLEHEKADIYGFSIAAGTVHSALNISQILKKLNPDAKIIFGGPQATLNDKLILTNFSYIDIVVRGEGEITFGELTDYISRKCDLSEIKGISWRNASGKIISNPDRPLICNMDNLPIPDYGEYDYKNLNINVVPLEVGRGCPYACSFCSSSVLWQRKYRVKSIDRIIKEIKILVKDYSVRLIYFRHDQIVLNRKWFIKLCQRIKDENINVKWQCSARIDTLDDNLLQIMHESGCIGVECGIETLSNKVQNKINKHLRIHQIIENIQMIVRNHINPILFFMTGFPEEDRAELKHTLNGILKLICSCNNPTFFQLRVLQPFPQTQITKSNTNNLIFFPKKLNSKIIKKYPSEMLKIAKIYPQLFPEFYYIKNNYDIPIEEFLYLEKIFNSYIRYLNSTFFLTFKYLAHTCNWNYEILLNKLNICKDRLCSEKEITKSFGQITMLFPKSIQTVYFYEKDIDRVKKKWTKTVTIKSDNKYYLNPNLWIFTYPAPIKQIIFDINNNVKNITDSNSGTIILMVVEEKNIVRTYTINKESYDLLIRFQNGYDKLKIKKIMDVKTVKHLINKRILI